MRKHVRWMIGALLLFSVTVISWKPSEIIETSGVIKETNGAKEIFEKYVSDIYNTASLQQSGMDISVFQKAITGFLNLKIANKLSQGSNILAVIDFSKPSCEKRMWIVDVLNKTLLLNTWVAHGSGSGLDLAENFSNDNDSHQSSLGFYITDDVYMGKHGRSLRLNGLEEGVNSLARARGIVIHAANYVSQRTINKTGRIGRSFGCPAVSPKVINAVINTIKGGSMLYINGNNYQSALLNDTEPVNTMVPDTMLAAN